MVIRILRHLLAGPWQVRRCFPKSAMLRIRTEIENSETRHLGELRFAVEAGLHWHHLWQGISGRDRAIELFSQLHVWDTEHNSGVLIYLLLADRRVEIIADRGIHARVGDAGWQAISRAMETAFSNGKFEQGVLTGISHITALLVEYFPASGRPNKNELPDTPVVL